MSISTCCRATFKYGQRDGVDGPEVVTVCDECGRVCGEFSPPCDTCGSDDPCSCGEFYDPFLETGEDDRPAAPAIVSPFTEQEAEDISGELVIIDRCPKVDEKDIPF